MKLAGAICIEIHAKETRVAAKLRSGTLLWNSHYLQKGAGIKKESFLSLAFGRIDSTLRLAANSRPRLNPEEIFETVLERFVYTNPSLFHVGT